MGVEELGLVVGDEAALAEVGAIVFDFAIVRVSPRLSLFMRREDLVYHRLFK